MIDLLFSCVWQGVGGSNLEQIPPAGFTQR